MLVCPRPWNLVLRESSPSNFALYPFFRFSEPDPLRWFSPGWSSGRLAVLLWTAAAFSLVLFYTSNLRAHMISVDYEAPLDTLGDIADNGATVYLPTALFFLR